MLKLVCVFTALLFLKTDVHAFGNTDCIKHSSKGCEYCVQKPSWHKNCTWCELDNKCHARYSTFKLVYTNPCNNKQVIKNPLNCPQPSVYGEYSFHNAYNLLRLSAIPYTDDRNEAKKCLESQELDDFEIVEWIGRHCENLRFLSYKECLAVVMISHDRKAIVLAYRGTTKSKQLFDEIVSTMFTPKSPIGIGDAKVQRYFKRAHNKLYDCVKDSIHDQILNYPEYDVWITGHSLGGAIASIASAKLVHEGLVNKEKIGLYTFGMPRVGNRQYALVHNNLVNNSWRVVHRYDPVPHFPKKGSGPYHHRTEVYYPSKVMLPTDTNYVICPDSDNDNCGSKFSLRKSSFEDHTIYFDIPVGTYCQSVLGRKRKRSTNSEMWNLFNNNTCSRIKNPDFSGYDYPTNRAWICTGNVQTSMLFILVKCMMFDLLRSYLFI